MHTIARKLRYCSKLRIFQPAVPKKKKTEKKRKEGTKNWIFNLLYIWTEKRITLGHSLNSVTRRSKMELNSETQHDLSNSEARTQKEKKRSRRGLKIWVPKFLDSDHNEKQSIRSILRKRRIGYAESSMRHPRDSCIRQFPLWTFKLHVKCLNLYS